MTASRSAPITNPAGRSSRSRPWTCEQLKDCTPVYIELPGWKTATDKVKKFSELPRNARSYLKTICDLTGAKLTIASVGPGRDQTIVV